MKSYKMVTYTHQGPKVQWFSDKKTALSWGNQAVSQGFYPTFEVVNDNWQTEKVVHFFSLAVKHFFKGGMF
jgi:hypothetical protein